MAAITTGILLGLAAAKTGADYIGAKKSAKAAKKQGEFNAKAAEEQAADSIARGEEAVSQSNSAARQLTGSQRANLAAQGIDINSGSAADVIHNDQALSALDAIQIRRNAQREARGLLTDAAGYRQAGKNAASAYNNQAIGTLLGGAAQMANIYSQFGLRSSKPYKPGPVGSGQTDNTGGYGQR